MNSLLKTARIRAIAFGTLLAKSAVSLWKRYRALSKRKQYIIAAVLVVLLFGSHSIIGYFTKSEDTGNQLPSVTLSSVGELSGNATGSTVIGNVRSVSEARMLAQSGGTVTAVHARLGSVVGAGAVLAELDNASQRAAVLQAEGAYESALASRQGTSPQNIAESAQNTYTSAYTTLDSTLTGYVDTFYGTEGPFGARYTVSPAPYEFGYFERKRAALKSSMNLWRSHLGTAATTDPQTLLSEADRVTREAQSLVTDMAISANRSGTDASSAQLSALSTARANINALQATITSAKSSTLSQNTSATAGANASVKTALGSLRAAQAALEKTLIRTPIGGTVNFFPIRKGDYVTALSHVATVAQNGALEIVTYVSEGNRELLTVGQKVTVEDSYTGVITSIAPALDPVRKQIEVHVGVEGADTLLNGQSVRITLPGSVSTATSTGPILLPLASVKLTPSARIVFSVDEEGKLVAHEVEIGDVRGDRIEIKNSLPLDLRIVADARGLSEGQKVQIATPAN